MHVFYAIFRKVCIILVLSATQALADPASKSTPWAEVFFVEPADGATVSSPLTVKFGVKGMTLMPAGVPHPESGHHHLLIDLEELPDLSKPIPADAQHIHFGKAQTETQIELSPGKHTLQLLLGDHLHRPHNKPVHSKKITIHVKDKAQNQAKAEDKSATEKNTKSE